MNLIAIAKIVLLVLLVACSMLGAFGSTFKGKNSDTKSFLYKVTSGGKTYYYTDDKYLSCKDSRDLVHAAFAFAILGWIAALVGVVLAVLGLLVSYIAKMIPGIVNVIVAGACFVFMTIAWPICAALYNQKYCGSKGKDGSKYDYGFAFLIITWILSIVWLAFEVLSMLGVVPKGAEAPKAVSEANA